MYEKAKIFTLTRPRLKRVIGFFLVFVGLIALVTPLTPGAVLFLFIGFEFLGLKFMFLERLMKRKETVPVK
jgi:Putative transmembrane protein (PGPGW)